MAIKYERIQFTPSDEAENAINRYIDNFWKDKRHRCSRIEALNHFVERGIEDWQRENPSEVTFDAADALDETLHRIADRAKSQRSLKTGH
jgi:hypothetical protein